MPSITYLDDPDTTIDASSSVVLSEGQAPEPPTRYDSSSNPEPPMMPSGESKSPEYESARRLISVAQIMALVSLLIGGVVLSTAAVVVAVMALRKVRAALAANYALEATNWHNLKRTATIALVMAALALALNIIAVIVLYPIVMEAIRSGDLTTVLGNESLLGPSSPGTGSSTWG